MSLYSQNYYGPSYGGPSYAAPAAYQYQYPQQPGHPQPIPHPPPNPVFIDPAAFRRDYSSRLDQLQFNSRPVIQSLSFYAQDYSRYADIVAQCLDSHIRKVPPWMKLPAFYLLDAISKNVYEPMVDDGTRSKMDEMLLTWRTGAPNGKELFGLGPQMAIERGIWGDQAGPGQITKTQVMSELNFALQAKERAIQANPNDIATKHHIQVLLQLRSLVEAGVSQEELTQILTQLRGMIRSSAAQPPVPSQPQWSVPQLPSPAPNTYPSVPTGFPSVSSAFPAAKTEATQSILPPASVSTSSTSVDTAQLNITNILSSLMKSGLVSSSAEDPTALKTESVESEEAKSASSSMEDMNAIKEAQVDYRKRILAEKMEAHLVENSLDDPHVPIPDLLYDYLSLQCQQCGMRYPDTTLGKKRLEDHLDLHFKQNRKLNQSFGRGHDRSWFTSVEDWVQELSTGQSQRSLRTRDADEKVAVPTEKVRSQTNLKSQYVTVPPGDEAKPLSCAICKEVLQIEFLEDEEEWVWRNAVKKDDRVYHATCHAEAAAANNLVSRLKNETGIGSRGSTPEVVSSRSTPPLVRATRSPSRSPTSSSSKMAGVKRKIEHDGPADMNDWDQTPPAKKLALAQS
ncbi:hypothetical protein Agabi119p4_4402 [Agaricus bisporus var. burnettii]|uniref:CID domain-containing protein n=1 Tax=Agaricus bisporus var. burnettii TaxID=192524 RepID=A0A8H7KGW9_AGABI|nr:hypothetical protein Agabi119p4_4402 [Agaricus bisporus var. burnettii]